MTPVPPLVTIYTDGGCQGNPGVGGWGAVLINGRHRKEIFGGEAATTNNRMELRAAIESLSLLTKPCIVHLHTDSQYLRQGITGWIFSWKKNGWKTSTRQPVKNADLWQALDQSLRKHQISWHWVKGHAGNPENERCDQLAGMAMQEIRSRYTPQQLASALQMFKQQGDSSADSLL